MDKRQYHLAGHTTRQHARTQRPYTSPSSMFAPHITMASFITVFLLSTLVSSQTTSTISISSLPTTLSLPPLNTTVPAIQVDLPSASSLYVTANICSKGSDTSFLPTVLVSDTGDQEFDIGTRPSSAPGSGGFNNVNKKSRSDSIWRLGWTMGFANWTQTLDTSDSPSILVGLNVDSTGQVDASGIPDDNGNILVQIGVSETAAVHTVAPSYIYLGDTTADTALLLSPLLQSDPSTPPSYPNYTLPSPRLVLRSYTAGDEAALTSLSNSLSLVVVPTSSSPTNDGLGYSLCAIKSANTSNGMAIPSRMLMNQTTQWMTIGGDHGFRHMWAVSGLSAATNYTAWLVDDQGGVSKPIWFNTKESSFSCQLVVPNDVCPGLAYAAPLTANTTTTTINGQSVPQPISTLPDVQMAAIASSLNSFAASLLSNACGRDLFSHVSSCLDCHEAYRDWLCRIVVPQCATSITNELGAITPQSAARIMTNPRVEGIVPPYDYTELLPCLSTCYSVDRRCPAFLGFRCPKRNKNAGVSYAFVGNTNQYLDGSPDTGDAALDRWGNRWCSG